MVFAEARNGNLRLIFRFSIDYHRCESLSSRIVKSFHRIETDDPDETFPDLDTMREEVWTSIRQIWGQCVVHPDITPPSTIVEINEDSTRHLHWHTYHEVTMYQQYKASLLPLSQLFPGEESSMTSCTLIEYSNLDRLSCLAGRGQTILVRFFSDPNHFLSSRELGLDYIWILLPISRSEEICVIMKLKPFGRYLAIRI